jgi:hypothetical protein
MRIRTAIDNKLFIAGNEVEQVESFIYLGSVVTKSGGAEEDVRSRIRKANGAFVQLYSVRGETGISPGEQSCKFSIATSSQYFSMVVKLGKLQSK